MGKQLTGDEKIKDLNGNDICNYLGFSLCAAGINGVHIEKVNTQSGSYDVLYVYFNNGRYCRIAFNSKRALNASINEIRNIILKNLALSSEQGKEVIND